MTVETEGRGLAATYARAAMRPGVITCPPETPLREVALMMARYRIHAVVVTAMAADADDDAGVWAVVSDSDLVAAAAADRIDGRTAGGTARTAVVTVYPYESLQRVAAVMTEHGVTHALVVTEESERPMGVISTLDLARHLAHESAVDPLVP
jgi:CBS domain-containing protein